MVLHLEEDLSLGLWNGKIVKYTIYYINLQILYQFTIIMVYYYLVILDPGFSKQRAE